ncbi:helix-turn-helix transcriptional regulator [Salmonella enterica]
MALFEQHYIRNSRYVLTCREKDVMACLKWGKTCSETGTILGISERTVRFHIRNISDKLNVTTTRYAVVKAIAEGLI